MPPQQLGDAQRNRLVEDVIEQRRQNRRTGTATGEELDDGIPGIALPGDQPPIDRSPIDQQGRDRAKFFPNFFHRAQSILSPFLPPPPQASDDIVARLRTLKVHGFQHM
jgi:hypothetical protein